MWWLAIGPGLAAFVGLAYWYRHRDDETIDLTNAEERRRAAAQWSLDGEAEQAEDMLRAAVSCLSGFDVAVARGDLATFLAASGRMDEAIAELRRACNMAASSRDEAAEGLEMRIQLAEFLRVEGFVDDAETVLRHAGEWSSDTVLKALAIESQALHWIACEDWPQAEPLLEEARRTLLAVGHDRAATSQVSLALIRYRLERPVCWEGLANFEDDLKRAAVVNFMDRCPNWPEEMSLALASALLETLPASEDWGWAREQLHALGDDEA